MPSPISAAPDGNDTPTAVPSNQMPLDMGDVGPSPKTETSDAVRIPAPVSKQPLSEPSAMPSRNSVAPDNEEAPCPPTPDTLSGVVTHVDVTPEQVRITLVAIPDIKPATCYVDAATDGPVYEKSRFTRTGDSIVIALAPSDQQDKGALRATEVWVAMTAPRWFRE